jgi:hypothetical protein
LKFKNNNQNDRDSWEFYEIFEKMFQGSNNDDFSKMFEHDIYDELEDLDDDDIQEIQTEDVHHGGDDTIPEAIPETTCKVENEDSLELVTVKEEDEDKNICSFCLRKSSELSETQTLSKIYDESMDNASVQMLIDKINYTVFDGVS